MIYDGCEKPTKPCGTVTPANPFPNEDFALGSNGNLISGIKGLCATGARSCAIKRMDCVLTMMDFVLKMMFAVGATKTVTLAKCVAPVAANQKWKYDNATQQLMTGDGLCVTASAGPGPSPIKSEGMVLG